jgi:hypothetical protein
MEAPDGAHRRAPHGMAPTSSFCGRCVGGRITARRSGPLLCGAGTHQGGRVTSERRNAAREVRDAGSRRAEPAIVGPRSGSDAGWDSPAATLLLRHEPFAWTSCFVTQSARTEERLRSDEVLVVIVVVLPRRSEAGRGHRRHVCFPVLFDPRRATLRPRIARRWGAPRRRLSRGGGHLGLAGFGRSRAR